MFKREKQSYNNVEMKSVHHALVLLHSLELFFFSLY